MMADEIQDFLIQHGWGDTQRKPMPADWSQRSYMRLERAAAPSRAILMQTAPDAHFTSFITVDKLLRCYGASAPAIYAADTAQGLMLLEDFGDRNFGRLIDQGAPAHELLTRSLDVLIELHRRCKPGDIADLPVYDTENFIALLQPFLDELVPVFTGRQADEGLRLEFNNIWREVLRPLDALPVTLMLRDYMADNLMDLPQRQGWQSVGLLDFELAGAGPVAYDVASLTERVRRDLDPALAQDLIDRYCAAFPEMDAALFRRGVNILSAQRHLRILAILQQVAARPGQEAKRAYIPRIWSYLDTILPLPELRPVLEWLHRLLPEKSLRI